MNNLNLISKEFLYHIKKVFSNIFDATRLSWSGINFDFNKTKSKQLVLILVNARKYARNGEVVCSQTIAKE